MGNREKLNSKRIKVLKEELLKLKKKKWFRASRQLNVQERFRDRTISKSLGSLPQKMKNKMWRNCQIRNGEIWGTECQKIERAHRERRATSKRPRHFLDKLSFYQFKIAPLESQRRALENVPYFKTDDLTKLDLLEKLVSQLCIIKAQRYVFSWKTANFIQTTLNYTPEQLYNIYFLYWKSTRRWRRWTLRFVSVIIFLHSFHMTVSTPVGGSCWDILFLFDFKPSQGNFYLFKSVLWS